MRGIVGLRRPPKGGLGNRLLTYISLRLIADKYGLAWFSPSSRDSKVLRGIHRPPVIPIGLRAPQEWSAKTQSLAELHHKLTYIASRGSALILRPPLLGEIYAEFAGEPISQFVTPKFRLCRFHSEKTDSGKSIVVHLGSKSSHAWNPDALPGPRYFLDALTVCIDDAKNDFNVRVCTDDLENPAIEAISEALGGNAFLPADSRCEDPFVCDFAAMLTSSHLISGPSTFSITAGLLSGAKIVQYQQWVDARAQQGEVFWSLVGKLALPGYPVWKIV